jgi:hypothetical protein
MISNVIWHRRNDFAIAASIEARLAWYLKHAANCACTPISDWALQELYARGFRLPAGYGEAWQARGMSPLNRPAGDFGGKGAA